MYTEIAFGDFLDWNGATETTIFLANVVFFNNINA